MKKFTITLVLMIVSLTTLDAQYAALAIDQIAGKRYGWAVEYETQSEADQRALTECEKNGGECHVVLRFEGGCGAYVVERGNNSLYGWGTASTKAEAETRAMQEARAIGGKDLVVRVWGCNGGELLNSEEGEEMRKGIFYFHFTYSDYWKRAFISDLMYEPGIATKSGGKWTYTSDAESALTPKADQFMDFVEENLYGYLGEYKDEAYTRVSLDWEGMNEVKNNNSALDMSLADRKSRVEKGIQSIIQQMEDDGYEIIKVNIKD